MGTARLHDLVVVLHNLIVQGSIRVANIDHILRNQQQPSVQRTRLPYSLLSKEFTPLMKSATCGLFRLYSSTGTAAATLTMYDALVAKY